MIQRPAEHQSLQREASDYALMQNAEEHIQQIRNGTPPIKKG
ncbi:hypothetical protein [uncultured Roseibium sp.]|nr:hypothetical protein [uncultured Roseibium sp.]